MPIPFYRLPDTRIRYAVQESELQTWHVRMFANFMKFIVESEHLQVHEYLPRMDNDPFFLVAATGLGKTVAVPVHVYLKHLEHFFSTMNRIPSVLTRGVPRVWVVEPKISIAVSQEKFMNSLFEKFVKERNNPNDPDHPVLFGCKTSVHNTYRFAPIRFVTTGIFAIYARLGVIQPHLDRVIIDEAHVTIEADEGVELGIAICRQKGVPIDYMSATVDTKNLQATLGLQNVIHADKQRYPIWMHNTGQTMESCIVDLVEKTLVNPDLTSSYFPQGNDQVSMQVRSAVLETGRAKGMLIVVNSFAGENSDAKRIDELLRTSSYADQIEVLLLASAVIRNAREKTRFDQQLERIEQQKKKYVIIATSVVEMGVTFPSLDFIVTMDSGYENVTIGDTVLAELVPLGVNSLKQRIGRVGRRRPGIGYITNEVGAHYSSMSDAQLNGSLDYEPIRLPLTNGSLTLVAQYSFSQKWQDPLAELAKLQLPSAIHISKDRVSEFLRQRQRLTELGIAANGELTPEGRNCERWLGMIDLGYAIEIQEALRDSAPEDIAFYLTAGVASELSLSVLYDRNEKVKVGNFVKSSGEQSSDNLKPTRVRIRGEEIEFSAQSEIVTIYNIIRYFREKYAVVVDRKVSNPFERSFVYNTFEKDCRACGLNHQQIEGVLRGFNTILKTFFDTNRSRPEFRAMFGNVHELKLGDIPLPKLTEWNIQRFMKEIQDLPGRTILEVKHAFANVFDWKEKDGDRTGRINEDNTSLQLKNGITISAKLVPLPGNATRKAGDSWKVIHAQYVL